MQGKHTKTLSVQVKRKAVENISKKKGRTKSSLNTEYTITLPREFTPSLYHTAITQRVPGTLSTTVPFWAGKAGIFKSLTGIEALGTLTKRSIKIFKNT